MGSTWLTENFVRDNPLPESGTAIVYDAFDPEHPKRREGVRLRRQVRHRSEHAVVRAAVQGRLHASGAALQDRPVARVGRGGRAEGGAGPQGPN